MPTPESSPAAGPLGRPGETSNDKERNKSDTACIEAHGAASRTAEGGMLR